MKFVKWLGITLVGLLLVLIIVGLCLPSKMAVTRSTLIKAPPAAIYPLISDFQSGWTRWNTFDDEDPEIQYSYAGPASGVGAVQKWTSRKMGDGSMTITKADSSGGVDFDLLIGPKPMKLEGFLSMAASPEGTSLTWTDRVDLGKNPFYRLMGPLMGKMMGNSFEKSLEAIKQIAETTQVAPFRPSKRDRDSTADSAMSADSVAQDRKPSIPPKLKAARP
jgi:hypothetical protein